MQSNQVSKLHNLYLMRLYVNSDDLHHVEVGGLNLAGTSYSRELLVENR
jgi:hypothetical protein